MGTRCSTPLWCGGAKACSAISTAAPHAGWPLALGPDQYLTREGDLILCSGHGALFRLEDGMCVGGTLRRQAALALAGHGRGRRGADYMSGAVGSNDPPKPLEPGLYVVSTPIGNLGDLTFRALDVLKRCDLILAEDTRVAAKLLSAYGVKNRVERYDDHADDVRTAEVVEKLKNGAVIALVSDAGTPLVSDPRLSAGAGGGGRGLRE